MFGQGVVLYLFLSGTSAGLYVISAIIDLRHLLKKEKPAQSIIELLERAFLLSPLLICIGALFLILDLTHPEQFYLVFLKPSTSIISIGACLIVCFVIVLCLQNVKILFLKRFTFKEKTAIELIASLLAVGIILYTGFFLGSMKAIPVWSPEYIVPLFVVSSFSAGSALLIFLSCFFLKSASIPKPVTIISKVDAMLLLVEFFLLVIFIWGNLLGKPAAVESCMRLIQGDLAWAFILVVVCIGIALPIAATFVKGSKTPPILMAKSGSVLIGGLFLRFCIIEIGARAFTLA